MRKYSLALVLVTLIIPNHVTSFFCRQEHLTQTIFTSLSSSLQLSPQQSTAAPDERVVVTNTEPKDFVTGAIPLADASDVSVEDADIVIIGGGISGLTAAITAIQTMEGSERSKVIILEAKPILGGRVASDSTDDGYTYDHGFAVFIDQYPFAQMVLDIEALKLRPFFPGSLIKLKKTDKLARMSDPLRQPGKLGSSLLASVGSMKDKLKLVPLLMNCKTKSIAELFEEPETDTLTALKERWGFSDEIINKFFKPFLEGIYLAPLSEQSSRMFSFIFKMFAEGSATLPEGGMGAIAHQLVNKAKNLGVDIKTSVPISRIQPGENGTFIVDSFETKSRFNAKAVIVATDGKVATRLFSSLDGFEYVCDTPEQDHRAVGCLYYSFNTELPVKEPILILNGEGSDIESKIYPVNNVCFPSVINTGYAPEGYHLCSVAVLGDAMEYFKNRPDELDLAVRKQLSTWFPKQSQDILNSWDLKKIFLIPNAQPSNLKGSFPANVNGGRRSDMFRGELLPNGILVCGDHVATSSLNGAFESGVNAGQEAAKIMKMC